MTAAAGSRPAPLWKTYLGLLAPMILTNILQTTAGTIDGIYLGRMIGVEAVAAVSAFFPVFFLLLALVIGLSVGATVLVGQAWGARDPAKVRTIAGAALWLTTGLALVVALGGGLFAPELMRALGTPAAVLAPAVTYARLMLMGAPLIFLLLLVTSMSRAVGDAVTPLWALALATAAAMALTPAFIRGWFGLPKLGVASAAVSTLLAFALALAWLLLRWRHSGHPLAPRADLLRQSRPQAALVRSILRIAVPASLQMLSMAAAEVVLLGLVNRHGVQATAAYGAVTQVMSWLQLPAMSLGIATSILASHAIGAGHPGRIGAIVRTGLRLEWLITGGFVAAAYAAAPALVAVFLTDPGVAATALELLRIVAWSVVALGMANVLQGAMRASGSVLAPATLGMFAILGIELPTAFALNAWIGLRGIWCSYALAFIAMLVLNTAWFRWVWRHRRIGRMA
ncbi:MAG: MATE family efflux transporter [Burkholderiales bacterium]|nr:MATE family efflux transporter [Burkholderiales bacterium]